MTSLRRGLIPIAIAALIAIAYWPGLYGFWGRDDFMQLAFARLVGSPWPLFVHDHYFPVPGSIFRPLGFASFWLWQALFGTDYFAHAFGDMLLQVAVCLALYRVIRVGNSDRIAALLCTLVFALHPAVLGASLWWSARFDLLVALFVFVAVRAAFDHVERPRISSLIVATGALLAALLSKETALAAVAAIALLWIRWALRDRAHRADALRAMAALAAIVLVFFVWRWIVLGTATSGLTGETALSQAFLAGFVDWLGYVIGYLSFWPRLDTFARIVLVVASLCFVACTAAAVKQKEKQRLTAGEIDLLLCGLCLLVLPAVLQAPVAALNATPLQADVSAVEAAMQSRLYGLGIGGFAIMLSVPVRRIARRAGAARALLFFGLAAGALALGWTARRAAIEFASVTAAPRTIAEAVAASVDRLDLPATHCHVFLLGVDRPPEWGAYVSMDSIVKALSRDHARTDLCFIHADYATWFYLMSRDVTPADAAPYHPHDHQGQPLPWLHMGSALVAYLDPPRDVDDASRRGMFFLRYENGTFRNVSEDVAAGRDAVDLR